MLVGPLHREHLDGTTVRPLLVWRAPSPVRCLSSAVWGGGLGLRSWVVNAQVGLDYARLDPGAHLQSIAAGAGLEGDGVGLLTAASVDAVVEVAEEGATCAATVGLSMPVWAAEPAGPALAGRAPAMTGTPVQPNGTGSAWQPGTINLVCWVPFPLEDGALVNAALTATEAKTQALIDAGVAGTGTASDAVVICCEPGGGESFGGPRSRAGAALARAVHAAVATGTEAWHHRNSIS